MKKTLLALTLGMSTALSAGSSMGTKTWLVDDFEPVAGQTWTSWATSCDQGGLGTTLAPQPFAVTAGGSPASAGNCAQISGHLGDAKAPWPWATLGYSFKWNKAKNAGDAVNLSAYKSITFFVKGNGGQYRVSFTKDSVKDGAHFGAAFTAPSAWTKVTLPLSTFGQPTYGAQVAKSWADVTGLSFSPTTTGADYRLAVDHIVLNK